ncbi:MAG: prepilin-type N-terminal cleavage/methylation domain-containing protein [Gammaproteobacteria bacterium]|jgi:prepilin-type N-terminal cleavage/methylation domain-containing protein
MGYTPNTIRGFTLVELIGVLSIIAIMASVITPSIFKDTKRARQDKESLSLAALSAELERSIYADRRIPSHTLADWTGAIAAESSLVLEKLSVMRKAFCAATISIHDSLQQEMWPSLAIRRRSVSDLHLCHRASCWAR